MVGRPDPDAGDRLPYPGMRADAGVVVLEGPDIAMLNELVVA